MCKVGRILRCCCYTEATEWNPCGWKEWLCLRLSLSSSCRISLEVSWSWSVTDNPKSLSLAKNSTNIPVNRIVRKLAGKIGKWAEGRNLRAWRRLGGVCGTSFLGLVIVKCVSPVGRWTWRPRNVQVEFFVSSKVESGTTVTLFTSKVPQTATVFPFVF